MAQADGREKSWSLGQELGGLTHAVAAARMLVEGIAHRGAGNDYDAWLAPWAASAVLTLVSIRLTDLGQVLRGELNPERCWSPANAFPPGDNTPESRDTVFEPWTPEQERADAMRTLRRIERELQQARAQREGAQDDRDA
jgi:hypothetical protein